MTGCDWMSVYEERELFSKWLWVRRRIPNGRDVLILNVSNHAEVKMDAAPVLVEFNKAKLEIKNKVDAE